MAYWLLLGFWDAVGLLAFGILSAFWMLLFFIDGLEGIPSAFGILLECFGTLFVMLWDAFGRLWGSFAEVFGEVCGVLFGYFRGHLEKFWGDNLDAKTSMKNQ